VSLRSSLLRGALAVAALGVLFAAPGAQARSQAGARVAAHARAADVLTLTVAFSYTSTATMTLNDGTPVGATSGSPTVIPAGFYSIDFVQPGCTPVPVFTLNGPSVHIQEDLEGGELTTDSTDADFQPSSTYTWKVDSSPNVVHTFVTSSNVVGTPPPPAGAIVGSLDPYTGKKSTTGNTSVVGSALSLGTVKGVVSPAGKLTLTLGGKRLGPLATGLYTVAVVDESVRSGITLVSPRKAMIPITGDKFVGKRTVSLRLTSGRWLVKNGAGKTTGTLLVH
jgi:hypothetical protein